MTLLSRVLNHHSDKTKPQLSPTTSTSSIKKPRVNLSITMESPPVFLYGQPHESTGSIISGVLKLDVLAPSRHKHGEASPRRTPESLTPVSSVGSFGGDGDVEVSSVTLSLVQTIHYTKPFQIPSGSVASCKHCAKNRNVLARWDVLIEPATFPVGTHAYPFSHLLPGSLAASTKLGTSQSQAYIKYDVRAEAKVGSETVNVSLPLSVSRSILRGHDRNSLRVFPPTDVTASAVLPNVIYPKSTFPIELRLNNVVSSKQDRRWRMRKLSWKLEECTKVRASVCSKHESKLQLTKESQRRAQLSRMKSGTPDHKSSGLHHSTVQTSMKLESPHSRVQAAADILHAAGQQEYDVETEADEGVPNRPIDEAVNFDSDFSRLTGSSNASEAPNHNTAQSTSQGASEVTQESHGRSSNSGFSGIFPMPSHPFTNTNRTTMEDLRAVSTNKSKSDVPNPNEDLYLEELRVVSHGEIKSGWKSDFSGDGRIELVAEISAMECSTGLQRHVMTASSTDPKPDELQEGLRNGANISCDIDDPALGVFVSHILVVEVVVAEELIHIARQKSTSEGLLPIDSTASAVSTTASIRETSVGVPTGAARVLRMQFKMNVTERSGLGIAWDDEVPPMYEQVRALSPPTYSRSASSTPSVGCATTPILDTLRQTPMVLYGVGDTPAALPASEYHNLDAELRNIDEQVQEFRL